MKFFRLLFGVGVGVIITLSQTSLALANGDDVHLGDIQIPMVAVWVGGAILAVFLLVGFLLWLWASRALKRKEEQERQLQSTGSDTSASKSEEAKQEG